MPTQPSEPWVLLTANGLNDYLAGPQAEAVRTAALASGQADTFTNVMTQIVTEIRSAIRGGCIRNRTPVMVSATPLSVPPEMVRSAYVMIRNALATRISIALELTEDQKDEHKNAMAYVARVQRGDAVVTMPPDPMMPDDQQRAGPVTVVRRIHRQYTGRRLRGL